MSYTMRDIRPALVQEDAIILAVELVTGRAIQSSAVADITLVQGWWDEASKIGMEEPHVRVFGSGSEGGYCELIPISAVVAIRWDEAVV